MKYNQYAYVETSPEQAEKELLEINFYRKITKLSPLVSSLPS